MSKPVNYFTHATAAERYARGRPYQHPAIVRRICEITGVSRFESVLDVGCGTGQSTRAVAEFLSGGVTPFFGGRARTLRFQANITFLR
jgi:protein-L-isoaspartate O-methyltransferase